MSHLGVLREVGLLDLWDDQRIATGDNWEEEIQAAMDAAAIAVFLVSSSFLTSKFILGKEVPYLLQRQSEKGLRIYPIIIKPCAWQTVGWLRSWQSRPKEGRALSLGSESQIDKDLADITIEIDLLLKSAGLHREQQKFVSLPPEKISIGRLPTTGANLFGRDIELKILDGAWADPTTKVLSLVAWGGVGKTRLVDHWLNQVMAPKQYLGAERVFAWSFYTQGTNERVTSADEFIASALLWFDDANPNEGNAWDKGERLASLIKARRTLLILDGLEPLQYPPGPQEGSLKDRALIAVLRELAAFNPGLCVITTRLPVTELQGFQGASAKLISLEHLSPSAGAELLRAQGTQGDDVELEMASVEFAGHSLALTLLGSYLKQAHKGDIKKRTKIKTLKGKTRPSDHAQRVMRSYEEWFGEGPELATLRLLAFFDRPADEGAVAALRAAPPIPGLTDALQGLTQDEWSQILDELRSARLLADEDPNESGALDTHPLIREYFRWQVKEQKHEAWRIGNGRLYEHFKNRAKKLPATMQEMEPLFRAMTYGSNAGRQHDTLHEVYFPHILQGEEAYAIRKLGARGAVLSALAAFFEEGDWSRPITPNLPKNQGLKPEDQITIMDQIGAFLTAIQGYASPEVQAIYLYVEELCNQLGVKPQLYSVWISRWRNSLVTQDLAATLELARRVRELAENLDNAGLRVGAYRALGITEYFMGEDFLRAQEDVHEGIRIWSTQKVRDSVLEVTAPIVTCLTVDALTLWHLGKPDQAFKQIDRAKELAWELSDMNALALALILGCFITQFCGLVEETLSSARKLIEICDNHGFVLWRAAGRILEGWAISMRGETQQGLAVMKEGSKQWANTRARLCVPYFLALQAVIYQSQGETKQSLSLIEEARSAGNTFGEYWWSAELARLEGEMKLEAYGDQSGSEACFESAFRFAQSQGSLSLQLRATISLYRLRTQQGRTEEAKLRLAEIYDSFTEGFETVDLKTARALLENGM
jgi:predicted ATPase